MEKKSVLISFIILILVALAGSGAGIYYYMQYQSLKVRTNNPNIAVKELLAKVGKLVDLPTGEQPTVATVNDANAIKDQPFFAKAKNGYRVILYPNTRMAILYDEETNKIINFGTINVSNAATPSSTNPSKAPFSPTQQPAP